MIKLCLCVLLCVSVAARPHKKFSYKASCHTCPHTVSLALEFKLGINSENNENFNPADCCIKDVYLAQCKKTGKTCWSGRLPLPSMYKDSDLEKHHCSKCEAEQDCRAQKCSKELGKNIGKSLSIEVRSTELSDCCVRGLATTTCEAKSATKCWQFDDSNSVDDDMRKLPVQLRKKEIRRRHCLAPGCVAPPPTPETTKPQKQLTRQQKMEIACAAAWADPLCDRHRESLVNFAKVGDSPEWDDCCFQISCGTYLQKSKTECDFPTKHPSWTCAGPEKCQEKCCNDQPKTPEPVEPKPRTPSLADRCAAFWGNESCLKKRTFNKKSAQEPKWNDCCHTLLCGEYMKNKLVKCDLKKSVSMRAHCGDPTACHEKCCMTAAELAKLKAQ